MSSKSKIEPLDRIWQIVIFAGFAAIFVMGGTSYPGPTRVWAITLVSAVVLILAALRAGGQKNSPIAFGGLIVAALSFALVGAQLIPMPASVWTLFPGRQFVVDSLTAAGLSVGSMPLSLDPAATRSDLIAMIPALAFFVAGFAMPARLRGQFALLVSILAVINVVLGLAQRGNLVEGLWGDTGANIMGFFVNHNMYAAALYCSIPFLVSLVLPELRKTPARRFFVAGLAAVYLAIIIVGLAQSRSRAGFLMAIIAVLSIIPLELSKRNASDDRGGQTSRLAIWAVIGGVILVAQFGLAAASRLASTDPLVDYRYFISSTTFTALREFFPVGSGFGTFVPVYKMFELPEAIMPAFVNHAHNDWLELAMEGGVPAILLLVLFLVWFLAAAVRSWRIGGNSTSDLVPRAASIAALGLMAQSIVDYPLRDPNLMALFAIGLGFMAGQPTRKPLQRRHHHHAPEDSVPEVVEKARRPIPKFGDRAGTSGR